MCRSACLGGQVDISGALSSASNLAFLIGAGDLLGSGRLERLAVEASKNEDSDLGLSAEVVSAVRSTLPFPSFAALLFTFDSPRTDENSSPWPLNSWRRPWTARLSSNREKPSSLPRTRSPITATRRRKSRHRVRLRRTARLDRHHRGDHHVCLEHWQTSETVRMETAQSTRWRSTPRSVLDLPSWLTSLSTSTPC
jgi:hypothetical protein